MILYRRFKRQESTISSSVSTFLKTVLSQRALDVIQDDSKKDKKLKLNIQCL